MSQSLSIWLLILLALITANLPFVNQRLMAVLPLRGPVKNLAWRLLELVLWYFIVLGIGLAVERAQGQRLAHGRIRRQVDPRVGGAEQLLHEQRDRLGAVARDPQRLAARNERLLQQLAPLIEREQRDIAAGGGGTDRQRRGFARRRDRRRILARRITPRRAWCPTAACV